MDSGESTPDITLIWSFLKWFAGGLASIFAVAAATAFGATYRQHKEMHEWYIKAIDPDKAKLRETIETTKQESLEKYHKDVADIKHDFKSIQTQVAPILKYMANEEPTVLELLEKMNKRLDQMEKK